MYVFQREFMLQSQYWLPDLTGKNIVHIPGTITVSQTAFHDSTKQVIGQPLKRGFAIPTLTPLRPRISHVSIILCSSKVQRIKDNWTVKYLSSDVKPMLVLPGLQSKSNLLIPILLFVLWLPASSSLFQPPH